MELCTKAGISERLHATAGVKEYANACLRSTTAKRLKRS